MLGVVALALLLGGCLTPFIEGATEIHDSYGRDSFEAKAASGDPIAQYNLGNTYCCQGGGPLDLISVYDNTQATLWYCRSARKGYGPAQLRLAQIYAGHPIQGFRLTQHASSAVGAPQTDLGVALMWASVAAKQNVEKADALHDDLEAQVTPHQRAQASELIRNWRTVACGWAEVFPPGRSPERNSIQ